MAVGHGDAVELTCWSESVSLAATLKALGPSGAVVGPVLGRLEASAFMIVCLGMSVDFAFLR